MKQFQNDDPDAPEASWQDAAPLLDRAIDELPQKDRQVIFLKYFDGLSFEQMACQFGGELAAWDSAVPGPSRGCGVLWPGAESPSELRPSPPVSAPRCPRQPRRPLSPAQARHPPPPFPGKLSPSTRSIS